MLIDDAHHGRTQRSFSPLPPRPWKLILGLTSQRAVFLVVFALFSLYI